MEYPLSHQVMMRAKSGPFRCDHCEYWVRERNACTQKNIIEIANKKNKYGLQVSGRGEAVPLYPGDCSDFFSKK